MLTFRPLTSERWGDLEDLFGARGACGGCWCMWWRLKRSQFDRQRGEGNRRALKSLVDSGEVPGILAYQKDDPIAWCSVAPRECFPGLERSRTLKPIDAEKVWSVTCLFVSKAYRRQGISVKLLKAAKDFVRRQGGKLVEGYPIVPGSAKLPDPFAWTGVASAFHKAGYQDFAKPSKSRRIVRIQVSRRSKS